MITLVAACSENGVIGNLGTLPWKLSDDLKRFRELTIGKNILMGRKTFDSLKRPLPDRNNIVLTRDLNLNEEGVQVFHTIEEVISCYKELIVIGGGEIYKQTIEIADIIELTLIEKKFDGDVFFPIISKEWIESGRSTNKNDDFVYHFITYKKQHV
jgi:dihydrofolate reductase